MTEVFLFLLENLNCLLLKRFLYFIMYCQENSTITIFKISVFFDSVQLSQLLLTHLHTESVGMDWRVVIFSSYSGDQSSFLHFGQSRALLPSTNHAIFSLDQSRALLSQPITCSPQPTNHVLSSPTTTATWKLDLVHGKGSSKNVQNVSWIKNRLIDEWNRGRSCRGYRFDNQHIKNKIIAGCWSYILSFTPTATVIKEANCSVYTFWYGFGFGFGFYAIWSKHSIFAMSESSLIFRKTKINVRQQMKTKPFSPSLLGPSQDVNCLPLYDVWDKQLILF